MSTVTQENPSTELIKVDEIKSIMLGAGDILAKNESLVSKATNKGQFYLDTIEGGEMTDDLDAELNTWQVNAKAALGIMNNRRSPITQMMTKMASAFTSLEAKIDPAKPNSVYTKIQNHRNAWAKKKADVQRAKETQILKEQNIAKEKIRLVAEIQRQIRDAYQNKLYAFKKSAQDKFNSLLLTNVDEVKKSLLELKMIYPRDKFYELPVEITSIYLEPSEKASLIFDTRIALYDELAANFRENMEDIQQTLLGQVSSRVLELKEIDKSKDAETRKRLEEDAENRRKADELKLQNETESNKQADLQKVELEKQINTTGTLFNTTAALAEIKQDTGKSRQGYKITVESAAGWGAIFLFWFEKEGQKMILADMGKKTLDQMKAFCEKHAHKQNEKIDHASVVYEEDYKAIATKAA